MSEANPVIDSSISPQGAAQLQQLSKGLAVKPRTLWGDVWRRFRKHKLAIVGAVILTVLTLAVTLGPAIYVPYRVAQAETVGFPIAPQNQNLRGVMDHLNFIATLQGPSAANPFGTDELGRDLLARSLYGGQISLLVGFVAMLIAVSLGTLIGAVAGFVGGMLDQVLMRVVDLFLSLPVLPLLLLTVYLFRDPVTRALGQETGIFIIVVTMIGALSWMQTSRIVRAAFLSIKEKEFVEAAHALGVRSGSIMFRHILPNSLSPIIVAATIGIGAAIITESTLSFLGVGFPPDTPTWGRLVTDGYQYLQVAPHLALIPGFLIFVTVLSINFVGDGLRDALDPRSRL
ncbi:MAG TPA: ABC transporter permease [Chloroflexaceae bacterium]|nr:ABC transporter permease [Chloroflexaceae bacterium]